MKKCVLLLIFMAFIGFVKAQNHWTPMSGNQYNMTVYGVIVIDGVQQAVATLELGAFCGDECRASEFPMEYETGVYVAPLTIRSNAASGETITFKLYDHAINQELDLDCQTTVDFVADGIIIDPTNWFQFAFTTPIITNVTPGDWNDPSIWGGTVPSAEAIVELGNDVTIGDNEPTTVTVAGLTIPDGIVLTVETGSVLVVTGELINDNVDDLVIEDGGQLINESADVKATVEKDVMPYTSKDSDGWYTISSSVKAMAIENSDFLTPNYDLYRYNETSIGEEWENYKDNSNVDFTTFESGRGYLYANSNVFSPAFTGTLNNTTVNVGVTYTDRTDGLSGFNLIGNPFPHVIYKGDGAAIDDASLASGYYSLDFENTWHTHTFEDAIKPGQGILVKATETKTLSIVKSNVAALSETAGTKASMGRLGIKVSGGNGEDRAFAYFGQGIGLEKLGGFSDQLPYLWIRDRGNNYAIAHVDNTYESLDVYFVNRANADFTLVVSAKDTNFAYLQLVDRVTGANVDLLQQPEYTFHATGNEMESRFRLVFKVAAGVEETIDDSPFAFVSDGKIVLVGVEENANLQVFDMTGRSVSVDALRPGVYVLRLMNGNVVKTQKIVIQ